MQIITHSVFEKADESSWESYGNVSFQVLLSTKSKSTQRNTLNFLLDFETIYQEFFFDFHLRDKSWKTNG